MTLKETIELSFNEMSSNTDTQSLEIARLLRTIKERIAGEEFNLQVLNISEGKISRIIESNCKELKMYLNSPDTAISTSAQAQISFLNTILPPKLTEAELTVKIQLILTNKPEASLIEISGLLDDFYYDMTLIESIYNSLKS